MKPNTTPLAMTKYETIDIPIDDAESYEDAIQLAREYFVDEQGGDFDEYYVDPSDYESDFMDAPDDAEDDEIPF